MMITILQNISLSKNDLLIIWLVIVFVYMLFIIKLSSKLDIEEKLQLFHTKSFFEKYRNFRFNNYIAKVDYYFKKELDPKGAFYKYGTKIVDFPAISAALLKGKKHEWIIFAISSYTEIIGFFINKGHNAHYVESIYSHYEILKKAKELGAKIIIEIHNHPNGVLMHSNQDLTSSIGHGRFFNNNKLHYFAFVCSRGRFLQYAWWFYNDEVEKEKLLIEIENKSSKSRFNNLLLRLELDRNKRRAKKIRKKRFSCSLLDNKINI